MRIDLHHHLLRLRMENAECKPGWFERTLLRGFAFVARRPALYGAMARAARWAQRLSKPLNGTVLDPARAWQRGRELPTLPERSFQEWWARHEREKS